MTATRSLILMLLGVVVGYGYLNPSRTTKLLRNVFQVIGVTIDVQRSIKRVQFGCGFISLLCFLGAALILLYTP